LPGFVNAHTHAIHILLRGGLSQDRNLYDWLLNILYPGVSVYTGEDARIAASLYCLEAIQSGITTIVDNADWGMIDELAENTINTYIDCGIRAVYARMFSDSEPKGAELLTQAVLEREHAVQHAANYVEETGKALQSIERLMKKYHQKADGRISVWPSPGIPLFLTREGMKGALDLAEKYDTMVTTHLAESPADASSFGVSSTQYLAYIGFLNKRLLASHCVWMSDKDLQLLRMFDVKVANNAVSNQYLGSGIAPIAKMLNLGITVGIGTDDANCNDCVNMLSDMKHVALIQKAKNLDAAAITAEKVLEMATIDGAKAIGMSQTIGSIEKGKKADLILIEINQPHLVPCHHIPAVLVYQAHGSEVSTTIINGKVLMHKRKMQWFSKPKVLAILDDAQAASERIVQRAGLAEIKNRGWQRFSI
jgi:atrazine chlorohydrolase/5-methylthioadenosine/S-adenosylhomocysteine deaminase/melamine deaminase